MKPGHSPTSYEPTPKQMAGLAGAELLIRIGVPFESSLLRRIEELLPQLESIDGRRGIEPVQVMGRLDAVHPRHADVQEGDVRLRLGRKPDRLLAVGRLGDHLVLVEVLEQLPQPVARRLFIVDDQYLHRSLMHGLPRTGNAGSP